MVDFNASNTEILKQWKKLREDLKTLNTNDKISKTVDFWSKAPTVNFVLNYNEYKKWPTPWDLIYDNFYDSIVIAYLMSQTLIFSGIPETDHEFRYIKIGDEIDYCMILIIDKKYVLNYSYGTVIDIKDLKYKNCLLKLEYDNKKKLKEF